MNRALLPQVVREERVEREFLAAIRTRVGAAQTPTLFTVGAVEPGFLAARPFTP